ncbi:MAG: hypothetical protein GC157_11095 [Frankiales bacterium]|nr:hypothetical protein [Frankiales bacterium]
MPDACVAYTVVCVKLDDVDGSDGSDAGRNAAGSRSPTPDTAVADGSASTDPSTVMTPAVVSLLTIGTGVPSEHAGSSGVVNTHPG